MTPSGKICMSGCENYNFLQTAPVQTGPGAHAAFYTMGNGPFQEVKFLRHGVDHPPPSSAEFKQEVKLRHYFPSDPSSSNPV